MNWEMNLYLVRSFALGFLLCYFIGYFASATKQAHRTSGTKGVPSAIAKGTAKLINHRIFVFLANALSFLGHRITPMNVLAFALILWPILGFAKDFLSDTNYIHCPNGYAKEVRKNYYVACPQIQTYWDAEDTGKLLKHLEMEGK